MTRHLTALILAVVTIAAQAQAPEQTPATPVPPPTRPVP
jgi:hypothetical protein